MSVDQQHKRGPLARYSLGEPTKSIGRLGKHRSRTITNETFTVCRVIDEPLKLRSIKQNRCDPLIYQPAMTDAYDQKLGKFNTAFHFESCDIMPASKSVLSLSWRSGDVSLHEATPIPQTRELLGNDLPGGRNASERRNKYESALRG